MGWRLRGGRGGRAGRDWGGASGAGGWDCGRGWLLGEEGWGEGEGGEECEGEVKFFHEGSLCEEKWK